MLVGTAIRYGLDGSGSDIGQGQEIFSSPKPFRLSLLPTHPPVQWVSGFVAGGEAAAACILHSLPSSADFKNVWSYTSAPPICPHGLNRDNLTFTESLRVTIKISVTNLP